MRSMLIAHAGKKRKAACLPKHSDSPPATAVLCRSSPRFEMSTRLADITQGQDRVSDETVGGASSDSVHVNNYVFYTATAIITD